MSSCDTAGGQESAGLKALLTARDLQRVFTVSKRTLSRWCKKGELPMPARIGGRSRWRREDIDGVLKRLFAGGVDTKPAEQASAGDEPGTEIVRS